SVCMAAGPDEPGGVARASRRALENRRGRPARPAAHGRRHAAAGAPDLDVLPRVHEYRHRGVLHGTRARPQRAPARRDGRRRTRAPYHAGRGRARARGALRRAERGGDGSVLRITRVVDDRAQNFHARPSPDGLRIAFDSDRDGERAVFVADADGRHVQRVSGDGFAAVPSWSPDGSQLAFVKAEPEKPQAWNLWTVNLATRRQQRLTSYPFGQPWGGSWFPDGHRLAYSHEDQLVVLD